MATVVYRDAYVLLDGAALQGELNELTVEAGAESQDGTTMGQTTRIRKGGLLTARISGSGLAALGTNAAEDMLTQRVASDVVLSVFANGITEGSHTGAGFAMLGMIPEFSMGGAVGVLLPFSFAAEHREN